MITIIEDKGAREELKQREGDVKHGRLILKHLLSFCSEKKELEWVEGFLGRRQVKLERGFRRSGHNASSPPDRGAQLLEAACQAGCEGVL